MRQGSLIIDVFTAPGCPRCARARELLMDISKALPYGALNWRMVDVVAELDYAVSLGVRATPAIAINSVLIYTALPAREALLTRLRAELTNPTSETGV